jgi:hypothetical protein
MIPWAHLVFEAGVSEGGAIAMDLGALTLNDAVFRDNVAAVGSALFAVNSRELKISNATFDEAKHAVVGIGVAVCSCAHKSARRCHHTSHTVKPQKHQASY